MSNTHTFESFHLIARLQAEDAEPPDVQTGADAQLVAVTLFDWIAENVDEAGHVAVAAALVEALGLGPQTTTPAPEGTGVVDPDTLC